MTVHLVGAGPGDPDLLTVKAARIIQRADVVVHDRLVDRRILALAPPWAEVIDVGKTPGRPSTTQVEINELLVLKSRNHDTVVRLKGGDPFVFGRGGEEAIVLRSAGVPVEEVPGISSALAGPAAAGIPVTMRGSSSGFTVVTAHSGDGGGPELDWRALARAGTTLIILMGAGRRAHIASTLIGHGMEPSTPVAAVTDATLPTQVTVRCRLDELAAVDVESPAAIVIGAVADLDVVGSPERLRSLVSHGGEA